MGAKRPVPATPVEVKISLVRNAVRYFIRGLSCLAIWWLFGWTPATALLGASPFFGIQIGPDAAHNWVSLLLKADQGGLLQVLCVFPGTILWGLILALGLPITAILVIMGFGSLIASALVHIWGLCLVSAKTVGQLWEQRLSR